MLLSEAFIKYDINVLYSEGFKPKTRRNYRSSLNSFLSVWGDVPVNDIDFDKIDSWKVSMSRRGKLASSIGPNLSHLKSVLCYVNKSGIRTIDPRDIERPPIKRNSPTWLTIGEIGSILAVIERPRDKAIFAMLFDSGARVSELLSLNRDSIHDGQAMIEGKGDKPGILRFGMSLKYLDEYLKTRNDALRPLFVSGQYRRITVSRIEQLAHEYADKANIDKNVTPHVYRHSFASDLKLNGADIFDIQQQLRHTNIQSTMIYTHVHNKKVDADYKQFHSSVPMLV